MNNVWERTWKLMWRGRSYVPALAWRGGRKPRKTSGNIACVVSEIRTGQFAQRRWVTYYGYTRLVTVTTETQWIKLTAVLAIFPETRLIYSERSLTLPEKINSSFTLYCTSRGIYIYIYTHICVCVCMCVCVCVCVSYFL
jgi:hypothetical protein